MRTSKACTELEPGSRVTGAGAHTASICRHTPEVGAVCGKAARTDLCGGRPAMGVPTAKHFRNAASEDGEVTSWAMKRLMHRSKEGPRERTAAVLSFPFQHRSPGKRVPLHTGEVVGSIPTAPTSNNADISCTLCR